MDYSLNIVKNTIKIGLEAPIRLLHITDSHLNCHDEDFDSGRAKDFRKEYDNDHINYFLHAAEYAKKNNLILLHTRKNNNIHPAYNHLYF